MDESRDVVAVCGSCGTSYVEATRIGPIRLVMNATCPRCRTSSPPRPKEPPVGFVMRTDRAPAGRRRETDGGVSRE